MVLANTILNIQVERGASGGPTFDTRIKTLESGKERRFRSRSVAKLRWNLGYGIQKKSDLEEILALFYNANGRYETFLVRDWFDYQLDDAVIGTGDGADTTFQIIRTYTTSGGQTFTKNLTHIDESSLVVRVNGVVQTLTTHYTVDSAGLITFVTAPPNTHPVSVDVDFYFLARFDIDSLETVMQTFEATEMPDIPVVEVLE